MERGGGRGKVKMQVAWTSWLKCQTGGQGPPAVGRGGEGGEGGVDVSSDEGEGEGGTQG